MGKDWDKAVPSTEIWKECLRILKPGAFAFIMSAPRQDVLAHNLVNLSDAGFETGFTSIYWTFACVSEDTEILTDSGFKNMNNLLISDNVCSLDVNKDKLVYSNIKNKFIYNFNGKMINIKNKNTDQLVTPNHKILLKNKSHSRYNYGDLKYIEADKILNGRKRPYYKLPLSRKFECDLSIGEDFAELLGWIIAEGHIYKQENRPNTWDIRIYQSSVNKVHVDRIRHLLNNLKIKHSEYKRNRLYKNHEYTEHCFYINNEWKYKIIEYIPNKKPINDLLFLKQNELRSLFMGLINGDGSIRKGKNDSYAFYQKDKNVRDFVQILSTHLGYRTSTNDKKQMINIGWKEDTEIQNLDNHIFEVDYNGKVWCVETEFDNFVARRNGYIFITGNSGFPKAGNIGKLIDKRNGRQPEQYTELGIYLRKMRGERPQKDVAKLFPSKTGGLTGCVANWELGLNVPTEAQWTILKQELNLDDRFNELIEREEAEREITGKSKWKTLNEIPLSGADCSKENRSYKDITAPATPQAKALDGSYAGFQPKPAVEIIMVVMKPLSEKTYVDQALANGKGITWLDDGRIPYQSDKDVWDEGMRTGLAKEKFFTRGDQTEYLKQPNPQGRFPANLLVSDDALNDGKERISKYGESKEPLKDSIFIGANYGENRRDGCNKSIGDSGSFSRYFDLDVWMNEQIKQLPKEAQKTFPFLITPKASKSEKGNNCTHPTVKPVKLISWLITIGSQKGDLVLDPFLGSGTALEAGSFTGRRVLGFEISNEWEHLYPTRCMAHQPPLSNYV
jgi:hypothetical protein